MDTVLTSAGGTFSLGVGGGGSSALDAENREK